MGPTNCCWYHIQSLDKDQPPRSNRNVYHSERFRNKQVLNFVTNGNLRGSYHFLMSTLNAAQITQLFNEVDADHNGSIDAEEAKQVCLKCGFDVVVVPALIRAFDDNGDGRITCDEFVTFYTEYHKPDRKPLFQRLFNSIDRDHNNHINVDEMIEFTALVGEPTSREEAIEQLKDLDQDGDGKVSFEELWAVFDGMI